MKANRFEFVIEDRCCWITSTSLAHIDMHSRNIYAEWATNETHAKPLSLQHSICYGSDSTMAIQHNRKWFVPCRFQFDSGHRERLCYRRINTYGRFQRGDGFTTKMHEFQFQNKTHKMQMITSLLQANTLGFTLNSTGHCARLLERRSQWRMLSIFHFSETAIDE